MKRYVIERSIPGVGKLNREQLKGAAATSNDALAKLPGKVQWDIHTSWMTRPSASTSRKTRTPFRSTPS